MALSALRKPSVGKSDRELVKEIKLKQVFKTLLYDPGL